jgi:hypothetical protein
MELVRQILKCFGDLLRAFECVPGQRCDVLTPAAGTIEYIEIHGQNRQLLTDVVVQLARDHGALGFLRVEEPLAEVADALVAGSQLRVFARLGLLHKDIGV